MILRLRRFAQVVTLAAGLLGATTFAEAAPPVVAPAAAPAAPVRPAPPRPAVRPQAPAAAAPAAHEAPAAPQRTAATAKATLAATAKAANIPTFEGANGKVYVNPHEAGHLQALHAMTPPGSGVLQILQVAGYQHTLATFEGSLIHFQYQNPGNWRLREWGKTMRPSSRQMTGALIQLTPTEADNLRTRIAGVMAEQGPEHLAGPNWEHGKIRASLGVQGFNCASGWCQVPVGERGESVAKVIGIPAMGDPYSLQRTLETGGNERIFGIAVYGPRQADFGKNPAQTWTKN